MNSEELLAHFARNHVRPEFRERFMHEALKKPGKLQSRICHSITDVFSERYRHGLCPFSEEDPCVPITGTGVEHLEQRPWSEVRYLATPGFGLLAISSDGREFIAETEFENGHSSVTYSSKSSGH